MAFGSIRAKQACSPTLPHAYRETSPMAIPTGGYGALSDQATGAPGVVPTAGMGIVQSGPTPRTAAEAYRAILAQGNVMNVAGGDAPAPAPMPQPPAAEPGVLMAALAKAKDDRPILMQALDDAARTPPTLGFLDRNSIDGVAIETRKPKAFEKGGVGWDIVGTILDVAAGAGGAQGGYWAGKRRLADRERQDQLLAAQYARQDAQRLEDRRWQVDDRNFKQNAPQYFNSGRDRVAFDPVTGEARTVYDAPEDYESYADTLGFSPDDDGYAAAVQDYVLRGQGPTAMSARGALDRARQLDRIQLKGIPQARAPSARGGGGGRRGGGGGPTVSRVIGGLVAKVRDGQPLTPAEQRTLDTYGPRRGGRGGGGSRDIPTLTPEQARAAAPGTKFRTSDGRVLTR